MLLLLLLIEIIQFLLLSLICYLWLLYLLIVYVLLWVTFLSREDFDDAEIFDVSADEYDCNIRRVRVILYK